MRTAGAEADLGRLQRAGDVEPVRVVEHPLVAVGRVVEHHDLVAGLQFVPADLGVLGGGATEVDRRASPSGRSRRRRSWCASRSRSDHSSRWSGKSVSAFIPWLIALRVVSLPATTSRMKNDPNSCGVSCSPSTSASIMIDVMSSRGVARRSSPSAWAYCEHARARWPSGPRSVPPNSGSPAPRIDVRPARRSCAVSSAGMPIMSQMISSGSGAAIVLDEVALPVGELLEQHGRRRRPP